MAGWYLNAFLSSWREAVNEQFPRRGKASDGTIGDLAHSRSPSEHNPDTNGSVDAWDMDVNLLGSAKATGTSAERAAVRKLLAEFQKQPGAQLWIYRGQIANRDIGNWKVRSYSGPSPHDHHVHFQSRSSKEKTSYRGDLDDVFPATNKPIKENTSMSLTTTDAALVTRNLLGTKIGESGPTVGVALQSTYQMATKLVTASTAEAQRDAGTAAILAGMQTALSALASASGALTPEQVAALTDQVRQAAAAAGAEAVSALQAKLDSLREHLGDDA